MLFHKTLLEGIHNFPSDLNIRKDIEALKKSKGLDVLVQELKNSDPETHQSIDIKNARRVERALEIIRISGKKLSELKTEPKVMFFDQNNCLLLGILDQKSKLEALAHRWWDPNSEFKPLHDINPLRVNYLSKTINVAEKNVLDIGCGGGILAEALARLGARVTAIDLAEASLSVANLASSGKCHPYHSFTLMAKVLRFFSI